MAPTMPSSTTPSSTATRHTPVSTLTTSKSILPCSVGGRPESGSPTGTAPSSSIRVRRPGNSQTPRLTTSSSSMRPSRGCTGSPFRPRTTSRCCGREKRHAARGPGRTRTSSRTTSRSEPRCRPSSSPWPLSLIPRSGFCLRTPRRTTLLGWKSSRLTARSS